MSDTDSTTRIARLPHRTVSLEGPVFDSIFAALENGTVTIAELAARPELAGVTREELRKHLLRLLVAERIAPRSAPSRAAVVDGTTRYVVPSVYNQMMLRRLSSDVPVVMASTLAGTAFPISALEALAIRVFTEVPAAGREAWVRDFVAKRVLRIRVEERVLVDDGEQVRAILDTVATLQGERLAKLLEVGVLASSSETER